jgi:ABC-type phosphate/phosphonate transport system substrate-binding protein
MTPLRRWLATLLLVLPGAALGAAAAASAPITLVVCAPGYPGSTAEAQPTLDAFAAAAARAAGWPEGALAAVYHESESAGLDRLGAPDAALALVPLPFYLAHRVALGLTPVAQAVARGGSASETWTLVAGKGRVKTPADLAGARLVSLAAYAPAFVRAALAGWGNLPADVEMVSSGAVLSALRRAASGERVAVLLDREQADALPTLPFAGELEVVARSRPLPVSVLAAVGTRLPAARAAALVRALTSLGASADGAAALEGMRLAGFVAADRAALAAAERDFGGGAP